MNHLSQTEIIRSLIKFPALVSPLNLSVVNPVVYNAIATAFYPLIG